MKSGRIYDREDLRKLNATTVLHLLHQKGPMSRARIAAALGLTRATVSNIAAALLTSGFLRETDYQEGRMGRPGLLLEIHPESGSLLAVEIDIGRMSVVLTNMKRIFLWRRDLALEDGMDAGSTLLLAEELIDEALAFSQTTGLPCHGMGVALAGLVNHAEGELAYGPILGWERIPFKTRWEERFDIPVLVENEAHAGARGAFLFDNEGSVQHLLYLSLGVGLGAGIISDGALLRGHLGFAGQVGHSPFLDNGVRCGCGQIGCWVTEVGAEAFLRKLSTAGVELRNQKAPKVDWVSEAERLAAEGNPEVLHVLEEIGRQLGRGLARLTQTFNPARIILGGHMGPLMAHVRTAVLAGLEENALPRMPVSLELKISTSKDEPVRGCLAGVFTMLITNPRLKG